MGILKDLTEEMTSIASENWSFRDGQSVPDPEDVGLSNEGVRLGEATVLYADMAESTTLVNNYKDWFSAESVS